MSRGKLLSTTVIAREIAWRVCLEVAQTLDSCWYYIFGPILRVASAIIRAMLRMDLRRWR